MEIHYEKRFFEGERVIIIPDLSATETPEKFLKEHGK